MFRSMLPFFVAIAVALPINARAVVELPTVPLTINGHRITAEVAKTSEQVTNGLMHRFSLKPDHGWCSSSSAPSRERSG
jgi:hypothetical protein